MSDDLETFATALNAHPDYVVLRKLHPVSVYSSEPALQLRRALLVDVETTGLSFATDAIIELGIVLFTYDASSGRIQEVLAAESWLDDPGRAIPESVSKLTGIADADVKGQRIDETRVRELAIDANFIIAHNAAFDRPFVDRRLPFLADRNWGCSMNDVPWKAKNLGSQKLDYLLYTHTRSFLDTHHRALDDCRATLHLLATPFADASSPLNLMLLKCRARHVRVAAVGSTFAFKDVLKQRGYSWSGDEGTPAKTWCREMLEAEVEGELGWLRENVYASSSAQPTTVPVNSKARYRG